MKRRTTLALAFVALLAAPSPVVAISLQDSFTQRMEEGLALYDGGDYAAARRAFQDARMLRPSSVEARMNLALAYSREGDVGSARGLFEEIARNSSAPDEYRADALYNLGTLAMLEAEIILDDPEGEMAEAIPPLLDSIMRFNRTLELDSEYEKARFNRAQAQHMLQEIAEMMPPPMDMEQEMEEESDPDAEPEEGEDEDESSESPGPEDDGEEESEGDPDGEQEEGDDADDSRDGAEGDDGDEQTRGDLPPDDPSDQNGEDGEESDGRDGERDPWDEEEGEGAEMPVALEEFDGMTEEEANQLLNLLGNDNLLPLGRASRTHLDRNW